MHDANRCIQVLLVLLFNVAVSAGEAGADQIIPKTDAEIVNEAHIIVDATVTEIILPPAEAIEKKMCYSIAVLKVNEVLKDTNGQVAKDGTTRFVYLSHGRSFVSWGPDSYSVGERGIFALCPLIGGWLQAYGIAVAEGSPNVKWRNPYRLHYNQQIQGPGFRKLAAISMSPEKALADADPSVVAGAIYLAARKQREEPSQELVNAILAGMKSEGELMKEACNAAGFVRLKEAVPIGIALLKEGRGVTEAARALAGIGEPAVEPLADVARTAQDARLRADAVKLLSDMLVLVRLRQVQRQAYHSAIQEILVEKLSDAEPVARAAAEGLKELEVDAKLLSKILHAFNTTTDESQAGRLGHCLHYYLHPAGLKKVWEQLGSDDATVAARSARVAAGSTPEGVAELDVAPLRAYLARHPPTPSENLDMSHVVARLRRDPGTLPVFIKLYEDTASPIALETIGYIGGPDAVKYLAPLVTSAEPKVAAMAVFTLSRTREPDLAAVAMVLGSAHKEAEVRKAAARGILIYQAKAKAFLERMMQEEQDEWTRKVIDEGLKALATPPPHGHPELALYETYAQYVRYNALDHWRKQKRP